MNINEAIEARHSVRSYEDIPLTEAEISRLQAAIDECNAQSGLHIQLVCNERGAFDNFLAHYGKFSGVQSYIALVGRKGADFDELTGYFGEKVVLEAQMMGLNTCWVAMTMSKGTVRSNASIADGEKLGCVIALGHGATQGVPHTGKALADVCQPEGKPAWFLAGVEAALLAPTAMNQQKFSFTLAGSQVTAKAGSGFYSKVDLGIAKLHFEIGAGAENFSWA